MENLITLCADCHRKIHDGKLYIVEPANANGPVEFLTPQNCRFPKRRNRLLET